MKKQYYLLMSLVVALALWGTTLGGQTGCGGEDGSSGSGTGSTATGGTSSTGGNGSSTAGDTCVESNLTLKPVISNVALLLDKSGSMELQWDHDLDANTPMVTRWHSLHDVIDQVLNNYNTKLNFGAGLFPSTNATSAYSSQACPVNNPIEVPITSLNKDNILSSIPQAGDINLQGATPMASGLQAAISQLQGLDSSVPKAIVLVTDGAANCSATAQNNAELFESYDASVSSIIDNANKNDGITTYVIGIAIQNATSPVAVDGNPDNTNPYEKLNELAVSGGSPRAGAEKFYNSNDQFELSEAFNAVAKASQSCKISLNPKPSNLNTVQVLVNGAEIPKINNCDVENGWNYVSGSDSVVELCGSACDSLKLKGEANINYLCSN